MRLIDADALLKILHNFFDGKIIDEPTYILRDVFCYIDNAPTVPLPNFKAGYKQTILDGQTNFKRPQGEWICKGIETGALGIQYEIKQCNKCGFEHSLCIPKNFCPNCGADMRGKENATD